MLHALSADQIDRFIADGFVRLDAAFPCHLADEGRAILWRDTGCDPEDPSTWTRPVIRLGLYGEAPFAAAANAPVLQAAFDQLVGAGRWLARPNLGTFPVRFPSSADPGDVGWHIDVSFGTEDPDFLNWRANIVSRGRALLMLFLFSDVTPGDAPTRIRVGSHRDIARQLAPAGAAGLTLRELAADGFAGSAHRPETTATGSAGTVYLCHPFLVHSAQPNRAGRPRFMAQPPLLPAGPMDPWRTDGAASPVERAIRDALDGD
ncbi:phytanoyl-CoA dioxygenase [Allostella vacuolata]|nr:phytanoyl-CoA dioxygenase [Stella vacuolata]